MFTVDFCTYLIVDSETFVLGQHWSTDHILSSSGLEQGLANYSLRVKSGLPPILETKCS